MGCEDLIRDYRNYVLGWTQQQAADEMAVSRTLFNKWENGKPVSRGRIIQLARVYGTDYTRCNEWLSAAGYIPGSREEWLDNDPKGVQPGTSRVAEVSAQTLAEAINGLRRRATYLGAEATVKWLEQLSRQATISGELKEYIVHFYLTTRDIGSMQLTPETRVQLKPAFDALTIIGEQLSRKRGQPRRPAIGGKMAKWGRSLQAGSGVICANFGSPALWLPKSPLQPYTDVVLLDWVYHCIAQTRYFIIEQATELEEIAPVLRHLCEHHVNLLVVRREQIRRPMDFAIASTTAGRMDLDLDRQPLGVHFDSLTDQDFARPLQRAEEELRNVARPVKDVYRALFRRWP